MTELTEHTAVCLALGYFDSVHLGHRNLIALAHEYAKKHGIQSAVATFSNNAYRLFNPEDKQVYTFAERCTLLDGMCDRVLPMYFDLRMKETPAEDFLDGLTAKYDIKAMFCGYDYLFGAGAEGDADFLKRYCKKKGIDCVVADKFEVNGSRVSTTVIRELLAEGDIQTANTLLGAPFFIAGRVVAGRGAGRLFDIPTANVKHPQDKLLPKTGVYGATCVIDGAEYVGAVNIGPRPTFGLSKTVVEMMIRDFSDNIYDKEIKICLHKYLRDVTAFETPALLSGQVRKDIKWRDK